MTPHPNRSKSRPRRNPTPDQVRRAREAAGLTQTEAAALVYCQPLAWARWEAGDRTMHQAFWELWLLKTSHQA